MAKFKQEVQCAETVKTFDAALDETGLGRYNVAVLMTCNLLILAMFVDLFGFSIVLPAASCDLGLTTSQQAMLSAIPLIGVMSMSYVWGLSADTLGRRKTLLFAMSVGFVLNLAASLAPGFTSMAILKFISAAFTASANAAGFVIVGEMTPARHRDLFIFLMASTTLLSQFTISLFAIPILPLKFHHWIEFLNIEYTSWRLLMQAISLPGGIGALALWCLDESPKFLMSKGRSEEALATLGRIYAVNNYDHPYNYRVKSIYMEEDALKGVKDMMPQSRLRRLWEQTAPLFRPPLLKHCLKLYYILLTTYMTSTGYTMWVPTLTNSYFRGNDVDGKSFCEVASVAVKASANNTNMVDACETNVHTNTLYAVMAYSGLNGLINIFLAVIVGYVGRKKTLLLIFGICTICGFSLSFSHSPAASITLFYSFLYIALVLGYVNSYIIELIPTSYRSMATCLSVVVARGSGFVSVNLIAYYLGDYCEPTVYAFVALVASGGVVALFLPSDKRKEDQSDKIQITKV